MPCSREYLCLSNFRSQTNSFRTSLSLSPSLYLSQDISPQEITTQKHFRTLSLEYVSSPDLFPPRMCQKSSDLVTPTYYTYENAQTLSPSPSLPIVFSTSYSYNAISVFPIHGVCPEHLESFKTTCIHYIRLLY